MCDVCDVWACAFRRGYGCVYARRTGTSKHIPQPNQETRCATPNSHPHIHTPHHTHTSTLIPPTPHPHIHTHTSHHTHTSPLIPPTPHSPMHTYPDVNRHIHTLVGLPLNDGLSYCILKMEEPLCEVVAVK